MKPYIIPYRHDHTFLHRVDVLLLIFARVEASALGPLKK
jgi:hypothetical protein